MTKEQAQEFRARLLMISANDIPDQAAITPEQERQRLVVIGEMASATGLPPRERRDLETVRARWAKLRGLAE